MKTIIEFITVFRLYLRHNPVRYAWASAWRIAVNKLPF